MFQFSHVKDWMGPEVYCGRGIQVCLYCCLNISPAEEETLPVDLSHESQTLVPPRKTGKLRSHVRVRKRRGTSPPVSSFKRYSSSQKKNIPSQLFTFPLHHFCQKKKKTKN